MAIERNAKCSETVCPVCGMKITFEDGVCYCPAEFCCWRCDQCKKEAEEKGGTENAV